jgi:hypothetical protein
LLDKKSELLARMLRVKRSREEVERVAPSQLEGEQPPTVEERAKFGAMFTTQAPASLSERSDVDRLIAARKF